MEEARFFFTYLFFQKRKRRKEMWFLRIPLGFLSGAAFQIVPPRLVLFLSLFPGPGSLLFWRERRRLFLYKAGYV